MESTLNPITTNTNIKPLRRKSKLLKVKTIIIITTTPSSNASTITKTRRVSRRIEITNISI